MTHQRLILKPKRTSLRKKEDYLLRSDMLLLQACLVRALLRTIKLKILLIHRLNHSKTQSLWRRWVVENLAQMKSVERATAFRMWLTSEIPNLTLWKIPSCCMSTRMWWSHPTKDRRKVNKPTLWIWLRFIPSQWASLTNWTAFGSKQMPAREFLSEESWLSTSWKNRQMNLEKAEKAKTLSACELNGFDLAK